MPRFNVAITALSVLAEDENAAIEEVAGVLHAAGWDTAHASTEELLPRQQAGPLEDN